MTIAIGIITKMIMLDSKIKFYKVENEERYLLVSTFAKTAWWIAEPETELVYWLKIPHGGWDLRNLKKVKLKYIKIKDHPEWLI